MTTPRSQPRHLDFDTRGNVLGTYYTGGWGGKTVGFIRDSQGKYTELADLVGGGDHGIVPVAMNNRCVIIGLSRTGSWSYHVGTGKFRRIEYDASTTTTVTDINDAGTIVGIVTYQDAPTWTEVGFILPQHGGFELLQTPGSLHTRLLSINDKGQISAETSSSRYFADGAFILEVDGSRTPVTARHNGELVRPSSLGNNGDFIDTCVGMEDQRSLCIVQGGDPERDAHVFSPRVPWR